ncbi:phytanoyl-CoA dioxygenase family protein [Granulicella sp. L60]|uniref:phytanoyl-CoA dioxygenase family protein n=1 Tax=Granulicella sp. L60 TaxID=1641866 RepID=UPI00131B3123|nr:phytanoyl-CoA dioxygenase family protein [Granulicella sp. L60]
MIEYMLKPFREIYAKHLDLGSLNEEMNAHGYLFLKGLIPAKDVRRLLDEIVEILHVAEWFIKDSDPASRVVNISSACGDPDPAFKSVYEKVFNLESFHAFTHQAILRQVMHQLVGSNLLIHPKPVGRLIFPNCERLIVHAHQDHRAISGDSESYTVWMPLHDCPPELGPLQILEASHRYGLQSVDPETGIIPKESAQGADWVAGHLNAGDVLIFHSLTVHAASANVSNQLRISMDCRFQSAERPIDPANLVFPGSSKQKSWEKTYSNWHSESLKYFWTKMPLKLNPSRAELAELAQTSSSEKMRSRYAAILSQLESQQLSHTQNPT